MRRYSLLAYLSAQPPGESMSESLRLPRQAVRSSLEIPSPFFLAQGFSAEILDAMDVGHSTRRGTTILPLYDDSGEVCVSFYTRSELPKCDKCKLHHRT